MICLAAFFSTIMTAEAQSNVVRTLRDKEGWQLVVDDEPFFVKGVVYTFHPPGTNFNYDIWREDEKTIQEYLDREARLMYELGVNTIRCFWNPPPRWIEYLYVNYGIYTIVNDMFSRYGITLRGHWYPVTNYEDSSVREQVLWEAMETVKTYRDVPGVLMFLFGNENNYGLTWGTNAVMGLENVSVEETKARALYSLFEEALKRGKELDKNHPFGIVNGDVGFLDLIAEECPSLDLLGLNVYRGFRSGSAFYENISATLDLPLMYTEFGADAWNVRERREDQYAQAVYLSEQWREVYSQSYGKGMANTLGGCVFAWSDEWYKYQTNWQINLDTQETSGDWENASYPFDHAPGMKNMNEEWFGITALGPIYAGKFPVKQPRAAFFALQKIWELDPLSADQEEVDAYFARLNIGDFTVRGLETRKDRNSLFKINNEISLLWIQGGNDIQKNFDGRKPMAAFNDTSWGAEVRTTLSGISNETFFGALEGAVTVQLRHDAIDGNPVHSSVEKTIQELNSGRNVDVYSAWINWTGRDEGFRLFYHYGHEGWSNFGDFFSFIPEAYTLELYDRWESKAPTGVEFIKNFGLSGNEGFTILAGPEPYSGARPQIVVRWFQTNGPFSFSVHHSQELAISPMTEKESNQDPGSKSSVWFGWNPGERLRVDAGILESQPGKIGWTYRTGKSLDDGTIGFFDTLGFRGRTVYKPLEYLSITADYVYAGLVSDTNPADRRVSYLLADVGTGNRNEIKGGAHFEYGNMAVQFNALWRKPLIEPITNAAAPGGLRHYQYSTHWTIPQSADPFSVWDNREAFRLELILSYDAQTGSYLWAWNNDDIERGFIASSIMAHYSIREGPTDPGTYTSAGNFLDNFATGLPAVRGVKDIAWRVVVNPLRDLRIINIIEYVEGQSQGEDRRLVRGFQETLKVRYRRFIFTGTWASMLWGIEDYNKIFNQTYPLRWKTELAWSFKPVPNFSDSYDRIGIRYNGVIRDRYSEDFTSRDSQEIVLFCNFRF
jgi:hypothetical protein